jgi:hypothetical protein
MSATSEAPSDLELVRASPTPRGEQLCERLLSQARLDGGAFVAWSLFTLAALPLCYAPAVSLVLLIKALTSGLGPNSPPAGPWLMPVLLGSWVAVVVFAGRWFARRRGTRRETVRALFRDGLLGEAENAGYRVVSGRYGVAHDHTFSYEDGEVLRRFSIRTSTTGGWPQGARIPVLIRSGSPFCGTFDGSGRLTLTRVN